MAAEDYGTTSHGTPKLRGKPKRAAMTEWTVTFSARLGTRISRLRPIRRARGMLRVITETGWDTASVSQDQQSKVLMNVYLRAAARGWSYTFIYQMIDDSDSLGVFLNTSPLTPKVAATYIHNLTTILEDTSSNFSATPLSYTISNEPSTVHDLLMQKSSGAYGLAV